MQNTTEENTLFTAGSDYVKGFWFPYLEISHLFGSGIKTAVSYESRFNSVGVDISYSGLRFLLRGNDLSDPSALGVSLSYIITF